MESKKNVRLRINLTTREFEIDADPDFTLENYGTTIMEYLEIIKNTSKHTGSKDEQPKPIQLDKSDNIMPSIFGEYYNRFSKNLTNVDKLLLACHFIQSTNETKSFTISEASTILIDQGIKLSNSNAFNASNISTKKVFKLSGSNYRVSDTGVDYIKSLK